ncbi:hypothetical protein [Mycobacterium persicum]|uniref:Uncharacterized protein n=1 Tax=Mycobacterium persicum TaxID=1487726 RepID=A0AB38UQE5_9MYCO|nr:hypothetical protein [Mycobacterium persicum]ORB91455.1 hypothetical protein B1T49_21970 [Mycobacterium persicum]VAZ82739.1 hypothetical protein LAUMK42_01549 [Mycobacterium persicum]
MTANAKTTAFNNGSPFAKEPAAIKRAKADQARDDRDQRAADQYRARDAATASNCATTAADAMADLRRVMADNADALTSTAVLAHVARFADARGAERYATTFGVLMRTVLAVPPQVVLPPIIGGEVSLNMLLTVVGGSGAGKGTADKTAAAAVRLSVGGRRPVQSLPMLPVGTGEGINRTYAHAERDKFGSGQVGLRWHTDRALFGCRDIATFDALTARQGSTLVPELLKAYMGEELGFANAEKDRRVILPMHTYRLCLSAGVQPDNGMVLLNDQAQRDGVPQRFIWTPVRPGVARPRRRADAKAVDPLNVAVPDFGIDPMTFEVGDDDDADADFYDPTARPLVPVGVGSSIAQQIIDADAAKDADPFGRSADPLAGHRLLAQLKVAAALAVLHNRTYVDSEDWQRAERLIDVSSAVARVVSAESGSAAERDAVRQGQIDGHRLAAADDARHTAALHTVMNRVSRYLGEQADWVSQGAVTRSVTGKMRRDLSDALLALLANGTIERRKVERAAQSVIEYRIRAA